MFGLGLRDFLSRSFRLAVARFRKSATARERSKLQQGIGFKLAVKDKTPDTGVNRQLRRVLITLGMIRVLKHQSPERCM